MLGWFDPCAVPLATFDEDVVPRGWFHRDYVDLFAKSPTPANDDGGSAVGRTRANRGAIVTLIVDRIESVEITFEVI